MRTYKNLSYLPDGDPAHTFDLCLPDAEGKHFPLFIYFHGGGLSGGANVFRGAQVLAERGIASAAVEYRKYPTAHYPDFIEDCADAILHLLRGGCEYIEPTAVYVGGSSAGAYISQMLQFNTDYYRRRGMDPAEISGYVHEAGQPTSHFNVLAERGIDSRRVIVDETAPLYYVGAEPVVSPMVILTSTEDMENRLEQLTLLASTLRHFKVDPSLYRLEINEGPHVVMDRTENEKGENRLGVTVRDFIVQTEAKKQAK